MAEAKTKPTKQRFEEFVKSVPAAQRADCETIAAMMKEATRAEPQMWGSSIVGFGTTIIKYAGGRESEWPALAFSPRKGTLVIYSMGKSDPVLLKKLGKHKVGGGCLYIKRLEDVDVPTLKKLIKAAAKKKKG